MVSVFPAIISPVASHSCRRFEGRIEDKSEGIRSRRRTRCMPLRIRSRCGQSARRIGLPGNADDGQSSTPSAKARSNTRGHVMRCEGGLDVVRPKLATLARRSDPWLQDSKTTHVAIPLLWGGTICCANGRPPSARDIRRVQVVRCLPRARRAFGFNRRISWLSTPQSFVMSRLP